MYFFYFFVPVLWTIVFVVPFPCPCVRTDRTYQFEGAPADLLDTYHTYLKVPLSTSPPCSTEGGFLGTLKKDAQVGICCANHGTYSAAGNKPYASPASYSEGLSNAYGLPWTVHSGSYSLSNHGGTPCTFQLTQMNLAAGCNNHSIHSEAMCMPRRTVADSEHCDGWS